MHYLQFCLPKVLVEGTSKMLSTKVKVEIRMQKAGTFHLDRG